MRYRFLKYGTVLQLTLRTTDTVYIASRGVPCCLGLLPVVRW